jgi:hypothetical protein
VPVVEATPAAAAPQAAAPKAAAPEVKFQEVVNAQQGGGNPCGTRRMMPRAMSAEQKEAMAALEAEHAHSKKQLQESQAELDKLNSREIQIKYPCWGPCRAVCLCLSPLSGLALDTYLTLPVLQFLRQSRLLS